MQSAQEVTEYAEVAVKAASGEPSVITLVNPATLMAATKIMAPACRSVCLDTTGRIARGTVVQPARTIDVIVPRERVLNALMGTTENDVMFCAVLDV